MISAYGFAGKKASPSARFCTQKGNEMQNNHTSQRGVSLVDTLVVVALLAIVFTSYMTFNKRSVEANVSEAIGRSVDAMKALEQICLSDSDAVVRHNLDADYLYVPSGTEIDYIDRIVLGADCSRNMMTVVVWTAATGADANPIVELSTTGQTGTIEWQCHLIRGKPSHVPEFCRTSYILSPGSTPAGS